MSEIAYLKPINLISLENIDNINENFVLRSPPRGKIIRGPISNAFNRQNLGSIPGKSEKILFRDNESVFKKGFSSQSDRFTQYRLKESVKYSFPGPGEYMNLNKMSNNLSSNPSISTKGYGTGFTSQEDRYYDRGEYHGKYLPGPGEYRTKVSMDQDNSEKSNLRYKSLYNLNKIKSLKVSKDTPGPGFYNPIQPGFLQSDGKNDNNAANFYFASKGGRFEKKNNRTSISPGPGKYFLDMSMTSSLKLAEGTSFYFKNEIPKRINPVEKFLNLDKNKKYETPGPGEYNIRKESIINEFNSLESSQLIDYKKKLLELNKEKIKENLRNDQKYRKIINKFQSNVNPSENFQKGIKSVFLSKSQKDYFAKSNHYPGPSYYHPTLISEKKSFNVNDEKGWI